MRISINNSSVRLRNASFFSDMPIYVPPPPPVASVFRIYNGGGIDDTYFYTNINESIISLPINSGSIDYAQILLGTTSDGIYFPYYVSDLFITSSVEESYIFTEEIISAAGAGNWEKPDGVTQVIVECWGGGGAGGGCTTAGAAGGGGGGGQYARKYLQYSSPIATIPYVVGAGGTGTTGTGNSGADTTWNSTDVIAKGGTGGASGDTLPAAGGFGTFVDNPGSVGDVTYEGSNGGPGFTTRGSFLSGAGGYGAGSIQSAIGFSVAVEFGGAGGAEIIDLSQNGIAGESYSGGGGGACKLGGANRTGGSGGQGLIRLIYT